MHPDFDLVVTATGARAELSLRDASGQVAAHEVDTGKIALSTIQGLFDLPRYVGLYAENPEQVVAELGVKLADELLGEEIFGVLSRSNARRTLRVCLPAADEGTELARVPWEIARAAVDEPTLAERNLIVRAVVGDDPKPAPLELEGDEALRVLFLFAEAPDSPPLAVRQERRALQALFEQQVYPHRRVEADFLAHGVTRERLRELITDRNGYHVVHWSGHGHRNLLELAKGGGEADYLTGEALVDLLREAGGFQPRLFFLSACHSGDVRDWAGFRAVAEGRPASTEAHKRPGYTGTAHALLRSGIPTVVAMRYAVDDDYSRELALEFYRLLFAAKNPPDAAEALNLSRNLMRDGDHDPCDHATPVLYGLADPELPLPDGRSRSASRRNPRLGAPIRELEIREHPHFVGRTWELANLGANFLDHDGAPVAVIQGIGGMGKTALTAEVLDLWEQKFDWVLPFQAKPNELKLDNVLSEIHGRLYGELKTYHDHVVNNPADAVWRPADEHFRAEQRLERLGRNLVRAMQDEAILLVLDNFETNLKEQSGECRDAAWDALLGRLIAELPGTRSRVLISCRRPITVLSAGCHERRILGPLPPGEAALYLRGHPRLRALLASDDANERKVAERVFWASRFHPLLLDRFAKLVEGGAALRPRLEEALEVLESSKDYGKLPELFSFQKTGAADPYLKDALQTSIDLLIERAGPEARLPLWMIALANEPVRLGLLRHVHQGPEIEPLLGALTSVGLVTTEGEENPDLTCHELVRESIFAWMAVHPDELLGWEESAVRLAYADRLAGAFHAFFHRDATVALEAGRRALVYCVQAEAYDRLGTFAGRLVTAADPQLLAVLIPHLGTAAQSAPAGEAHWSCLTYLADALRGSGRPDASLSLYDQAILEAKAEEEWSDVGWIATNQAIALFQVGDLATSRAMQLQSAEAFRRAGAPQVQIMGPELEAYRIDIMEGEAANVLPEIERRLTDLENWWQRTEQQEPVAEAPNKERLARTLIGALDIATKAAVAQEDWLAALRGCDKLIRFKEELHRPGHDIAGIRMNRAVALKHLQRYAEAQAELERCLAIFAGDDMSSAATLSALADVFDKQGDFDRALELERRALAIREQLPSPSERAISHGNLANYLERTGATRTAAFHQLTALTYIVAAVLRDSLRTSLRNYAIDFRRAKAAGTTFTPPTLAELLAEPEFRPLAQWLDQRKVDREALQAEINQSLDMARQVSDKA